MAERAGPRPANGAAAAAAAPSFPPAKSQLYNANRPVYRPQPAAKRRRRGGGRGLCCSCCLWLTFLLIGLLLLAAIAGAVFYFVYRPHRPSFAVSALRLSAFNLSSGGLLSSRLDLNLTARNPNKRLAYLYGPISVSAASGGVALGDGSLPGFSHAAGNTTYLRAAVVAAGVPVDAAAAADLGRKGSLALDLFLESKAGVKVGGVRTKKIGVRVTCGGIDVAVPRGKKAAAAAPPPPSAAYCAVKLRVKIWKWYL